MEVLSEWFAIALSNYIADPKEAIANVVIAVSSIGGMFLSTSPRTIVRRLGFALGLFSQPFWFYVGFSAYSIGLVVNSTFFTVLWVYRFRQSIRLISEEKKNASI